MSALSAEDAERYALKAFNREGAASEWLAELIPGPWSARLTRAAADWVARYPFPGAWGRRSRAAATRCLADELPQPDPASNGGLQLRVAAAKFALRRAMLDTLKENPPA